MLGLECVEADNAGAARELIERSVAFAQSDHVLLGILREKFAEAPDAALVERFEQGLTMKPESFQRGRVVTPFRQNEFQQVAATGAAEVLGSEGGRGAARDAAEGGGHVSSLQG